MWTKITLISKVKESPGFLFGRKLWRTVWCCIPYLGAHAVNSISPLLPSHWSLSFKRIKQSREPKTSRLWSFRLAERILDGFKCYMSTRYYYYYSKSKPFHSLNSRKHKIENWNNKWRSGKSKAFAQPCLTNFFSWLFCQCKFNIFLLSTASSFLLYTVL